MCMVHVHVVRKYFGEIIITLAQEYFAHFMKNVSHTFTKDVLHTFIRNLNV